MIRPLLRTVSRFFAAVVLLALILCAVEVWFRWDRVHSQVGKNGSIHSLSDVVKPNSTTYLDVVPLLEIEMPTGLSEQTMLKTNEYGTRGGDIVVPKPKGIFRVVCLGGSSVFGLGLEDGETLPGQLQKLFNENGLGQVEIINGGCPGSGPLTNFLRLRQRLMALQPDLVLFCTNPDDVNFDLQVRGGLTMDAQGVPAFSTHPAFDGRASDDLDLVCKEFATADWLVETVGPFLGASRDENQAVIPVLDEELSLTPYVMMWQFSRSIDSQMMISIIPNSWASESEIGSVRSRNADSFERDLHTLFADRGIQSTALIHNPSQLFQQTGEQQPYFHERNGQLTSTGTLQYARSIANAMVILNSEILQTAQPQNAPAQPDVSPSLRISENTSRDRSFD